MGVSKRTRQREMKKNAIAALIIVVFAITVFSINSIGKFIAEKVISPISSYSSEKSESVSADTVKTEKNELYALCEGSYSTFEEAQKNAEGKYIFNVDDKFNVLSSIHTKKEDVEDLLSSSENAIITLTLDGISIKITGTQEQKDKVSSAVALMSESAKLLPTLEEKLLSGKMSALQVISKINTLKADFLASFEELKSLNSENQTVTVLNDMLTLSTVLLDKIDENNLPNTLKYVACAYACEYFCFLDNLE